MAANTAPIFIKTPFTLGANFISTVVSNVIRDGTGLTTYLTAGASGGVIWSFRAVPLAANTGRSVGLLYINQPAGPLINAPQLVMSIDLPINTAYSASPIPPMVAAVLPDIQQPAGKTGIMIPPNASVLLGITTALSGGYCLQIAGGLYD
jgi:hypothetical protein